MPKLLRSIYAGGYSDEKKRRLQGYKLPAKIQCAVCNKTKAVNFFSTIQQLELQNGMATGQVGNPAIEGWVPCVSCTPKQVTELQCCICDEVKDLDGFAKAQRRLGEEAKCITCMTDLNGESPVEGSYSKHLQARLQESDDDDSDTMSNAHEDSTFSETESSAGVDLPSSSGYDINNEDLSSLDLPSNARDSEPSASHASMSASATNTKRLRVPAGASKWQNFAKENSGDPVESTSHAEFMGYDRDGKTHRMVHPPSTVDSDESDSTIPDPHEQARAAKQERDARSRFARIPGGRAAPVAVPTYVGGKTVSYPQADFDDDDDEDDDWGTI